jgi:hypothetical protein
VARKLPRISLLQPKQKEGPRCCPLGKGRDGRLGPELAGKRKSRLGDCSVALILRESSNGELPGHASNLGVPASNNWRDPEATPNIPPRLLFPLCCGGDAQRAAAQIRQGRGHRPVPTSRIHRPNRHDSAVRRHTRPSKAKGAHESAVLGFSASKSCGTCAHDASQLSLPKVRPTRDNQF